MGFVVCNLLTGAWHGSIIRLELQSEKGVEIYELWDVLPLCKTGSLKRFLSVRSGLEKLLTD